MKKLAILVALVAGLLAVSGVAAAPTPVTYEFSGSLTWVGGSLIVGDPFSGEFTIDMDQVNDGDPDVQWYTYTAFSLVVGGETLNWPNGWLKVENDGVFAGDKVDINFGSGSVGGLTFTHGFLRLAQWSPPTAITSADLPFNTNLDDWFFKEVRIFATGVDIIGSLDVLGPAPTNTPPVADAGVPYSVPEGASVVLDGTASSDPDGDPLTFAWDLDNDATFETPGQTPSFSAAGRDGPSSQTVVLQVCDDSSACDTDTTTLNITNVAPTVGAITAPLEPVQVNTAINATAGFTDPGTPDTHTAVWSWGDGTTPGTVTEAWGSGSVTDSYTYTTPGVYTATLTVTDDDGGVGSAVYQYVVVYDPSAGFVTGGGWIDSPVGAYTADATLTGKATFGFVSKYKKGATTPSGQTEFQFRVADLNFHSSDYQWLVIAGARAQFKGTGTINGTGEYKFKLWAGDNEPDTFRIKIWTEDEFGVETVVYDNGTDQALSGGSIKIHKK